MLFFKRFLHECTIWVGLVCGFFWASVAHAGAWSRAPGNHLIIQTAEFFAADDSDQRFEQLVQRFYSELSVYDGFTLGGTIGAARQEFTDRAQNNVTLQQGITELEIFAARHWRPSAHQASAIMITGLPATSTEFEGQRLMGNDAAMEVAYIHGWGGRSRFTEAQIGYQRSLGTDADFVTVDATFGLKRQGAMLLLQSFNKRAVTQAGEGGLDFDLSQLSLSAVLPFSKRLSLELGGRTDISSQGLTPGSSFFFSIWWQQ